MRTIDRATRIFGRFALTERAVRRKRRVRPGSTGPRPVNERRSVPDATSLPPPRRWLALAALAAAVLIVPTASAGSTASIRGVGAGQTADNFFHFELSAHVENKEDTPETGFGQVHVETGTLGRVIIDVRCVKVLVVGVPHAYITGVITEPETLAGQPADVFVSDGGEPSGDMPVDGFEFALGGGDPNTFCQLVAGYVPPNVTEGNIVVKIGGRN